MQQCFNLAVLYVNLLQNGTGGQLLLQRLHLQCSLFTHYTTVSISPRSAVSHFKSNRVLNNDKMYHHLNIILLTVEYIISYCVIAQGGRGEGEVHSSTNRLFYYFRNFVCFVEYQSCLYEYFIFKCLLLQWFCFVSLNIHYDCTYILDFVNYSSKNLWLH